MRHTTSRCRQRKSVTLIFSNTTKRICITGNRQNLRHTRREVDAKSRCLGLNFTDLCLLQIFGSVLPHLVSWRICSSAFQFRDENATFETHLSIVTTWVNTTWNRMWLQSFYNVWYVQDFFGHPVEGVGFEPPKLCNISQILICYTAWPSPTLNCKRCSLWGTGVVNFGLWNWYSGLRFRQSSFGMSLARLRLPKQHTIATEVFHGDEQPDSASERDPAAVVSHLQKYKPLKIKRRKYQKYVLRYFLEAFFLTY